MAMSSISSLQREITGVNQKVDKLTTAVSKICDDLGTSYGRKTNLKIDKIETDINKLVSDLASNKISSRLNSLENSFEQVTKLITEFNSQLYELKRNMENDRRMQKNVQKALIDIYKNTSLLESVIVPTVDNINSFV
ncbi:hypothetical protein KC909_00950 [Candidatus Dojkabacteria bacterium]|uniref:Uncharacterized protein n=1 Tax=Candidatus Dojkabacteria bacterium TaxID=2099670 RepID=A0A955L4J3_9BACT|nr:hypothetical protein [Candidatus Dojkabacteria bacterium]